MAGRIKKLSKKKKIILILAAAAIVIVGAAVGIFFLRARSNRNQAATQTIKSSTAEVGDVGTTIVGTGNLATSSATNVDLPKGLEIEKVNVSAGSEVKQGDVLATVTQASVAQALIDNKEDIESVEDEIDDLSSAASDTSSTEYLKSLVLESELSDLKATQTTLNDLLKTREIKATAAGIVSAVNVSDGDTLGSSSDSETNANTQTADRSAAAFDLLTADVSAASDTADTTTTDTAGAAAATTTTAIDTVSELKVAAPVTGAVPQDKLQLKDGASADYTGSITWNTSGGVYKAGTEYTATIVLNANDGYTFADDVFVQLDNAYLVSWEVFGSGSGNRLRIVAKYEQTEAKDTGDKQTDDSSKNSDTTTAAGQTGSDATTKSSSAGGSTGNSGSSTGSSISGGSTGSSSSGSSSGSTGSSSDSTDSSAASANLATLLTIASNAKVEVSINVDELDILSVEKGQSATITMDALEGEEFTGTVAAISQDSSSSSGSSGSSGGSSQSSTGSGTKYTVDIEMERSEDMLIGMSASATINVETAENAVLIPVAAVQERDGKSYVYTSQDADGNLGDEIEVETGISDGTNVQITSGLSEGDTVYYINVGTSSDDETNMPGGMMNGNFGGGERPSGNFGGEGGERPSGGQMPSGN